jgi:formylglycine-generating enzyme required for sulfatase activity
MTAYQYANQHIDHRTINHIAFNMIHCPSGEFWMGSQEKGPEYDFERPKHKVKISRDFWIGETLVTQALWQSVHQGWNPSCFQHHRQLAVDQITWHDSVAFCNQLSEWEGFQPYYVLSNLKKDGKHIRSADVTYHQEANGYRLPTEAEWEYSAKATKDYTYAGSNCIDEVAWYEGNSNGQTQIVKQKKPNDWGLYDMSGNCWEWCHDTWDEDVYKKRTEVINKDPIQWHQARHVLRGGSFINFPFFCRVTNRIGIDRFALLHVVGMRLCRNVD